MRKKLKLDVDALVVTSFDADRQEGGRGTVCAHDPPKPTRFEETCNWSCGDTRCDEWTCQYSCPDCWA